MADQILLLGNIRTLYIYGLHYFSNLALHQNSCSKIILSHMVSLRVLRFHAPSFKCSSECIDSIGYLQQLRYLSIYVRDIYMTENSLCGLYKLQTLILESNYINFLPHAMGKLVNLRHLMIVSMNRALVPKSYFGSKNLLFFSFNHKARNELVASTYHVRRDGPYSSIRWLKPLTNLQRSLKLYGLENVVDHEDAKNANLQSKLYVESLTLIWNCGKYDECARNDKAILEGLQPHTNLKKLTIDGYNSSSFPSWFGNPHFSNLANIRLRNFKCKFLPLSKLPSLTSLEIIDNKGITRMGQDFWHYNAPLDCLENYSIEAHVGFHSSGYQTYKSFLKWKESPMVKNGDFSILKCLHIFHCKNLQQISAFPSSLVEFLVASCERLEYISLPFSSGHLSRLQKIKIYRCDNLKSVINLNNLLGTLKVLKLANCCQLKPDPDEDFDLSLGRVSFEEGFALVFECPGMREWCQWHGFTYRDKDRTVLMAMLQDWESDGSCSDKSRSWRWRSILGKDSDNSSSDEDSNDSSSEEVDYLQNKFICLGHLRGECNVHSSFSLLILKSNANPVLSNGITSNPSKSEENIIRSASAVLNKDILSGNVVVVPLIVNYLNNSDGKAIVEKDHPLNVVIPNSTLALSINNLVVEEVNAVKGLLTAALLRGISDPLGVSGVDCGVSSHYRTDVAPIVGYSPLSLLSDVGNEYVVFINSGGNCISSNPEACNFVGSMVAMVSDVHVECVNNVVAAVGLTSNLREMEKVPCVYDPIELMSSNELKELLCRMQDLVVGGFGASAGYFLFGFELFLPLPLEQLFRPVNRTPSEANNHVPRHKKLGIEHSGLEMAGTTSLIISNLLSSFERLSQFMPTFCSPDATSSSSISHEDVTAIEVNSIQKRLMEDLSRLSRMLRRIQAVLHDAEEREINEKAIQLWLSELREVAYDAEDVLDQYDYQVIKTQLEGMTVTTEAKPSLKRKRVDDGDVFGYQVSLPPNSIKIPISCDMAMRIIEIIKKFDEIANDRKALMLKEEDAPRRSYFNNVMKRPPSSSHVHESDIIIGREMEKREIIQLLMSHSETKNIVIPIVGMGGVGKTSLAQHVYNDPVVCQHFSPKIWVCVSEQFEVLGITKEIVSSIEDSSKYNDNNNLNYLQCKLKDALLNKKFLLILDDVWNERADIWEVLLAPFSSIGVGKIIITTRSMSVVGIMKTVSPLQLGCLHEEKSWLLFKRHAFHGWQQDQQLDFEQLGRRIAKKCGGLPLALKVIGGFLHNEFKEQTWKDVLNNNLWDPKEIILSALRISYNHLPLYLKRCFLYASLFPKDHYINKQELIRMWIDQGYIQLTERKILWEDIAVEYFEDLVRRSFFQCSKYDEMFFLHDMVHDLAQSITKNEICSLLEFDELKNIPKDAKHIFMKGTINDPFFEFDELTNIHKVAKHIFIKGISNDQVLPLGNIRTLYIQRLYSKIPLSNLGCLRVLTLGFCHCVCSYEFIDSIGYLQQLRYLSICAQVNCMRESSLCSLYKLQSLILQSSNINMLPNTMGTLINLRHLMIISKNQALVPKSYFGSKNLLTVIFDEVQNEFVSSTYHVRRDGPYSSIRWLKPLANLQRSLKLYGLENVVDHEDAKSANLQRKPYVERLELIWKCGKYDKCARNDKAILEGLQPHTNLKELTIDGYNSSSFPSWFGNPHFSNLTKIRLTNFYSNEECRFLPLSKLPSLTSLQIMLNNEIIRMGQEFWCINAPPDGLENYSIETHVGFPSSGYLTNKSLLEWKDRLMVKNGDFSSLKCINIFDCENLQQISSFPSSLEILYVKSCKSLEYIALPYSLGQLPRLQKVKIFCCDNLKSVINMNNLLGTLKVLKLLKCSRLEPDSDKDFDYSFGRVSFKEGFALVHECPRMREWCQWHGFAGDKDWTAHMAMLEDWVCDYNSFVGESDDSSSDEIIPELAKDQQEFIHQNSGRTVSSMAFEATVHHQIDNHYWKWTKKVMLNPRVEVLWWRMFCNAILIFQFLKYRRLQDVNSYTGGCIVVEDHEHVAVKCSK
ncbi:uncharacterized protein LOC110101289 [Dendrobium catenatum]|uniref:uncharacterized protein LOC110101289 n=1 Tax=Dendrobium catenatum TaxID=906689 RepID=UPI00109F65B2|nr:uncharacterized protein LOC110101289 [Dendrobium catenatum]